MSTDTSPQVPQEAPATPSFDDSATVDTMVDTALGHALGLGFYNAVAAQQNDRILQTGAQAAACARLLKGQPAGTKEPEGTRSNPEASARAAEAEAAGHEATARLQTQADHGSLVDKAVAQAAVIAIQDAVDHLRQLQTLSITAISVAMAGLLETGEPRFNEAIREAEALVDRGAEQMQRIAREAEDMVHRFSGSAAAAPEASETE
ncbi:MAG: RebB family R body protein [Acidobacteriota bacterium]